MNATTADEPQQPLPPADGFTTFGAGSPRCGLMDGHYLEVWSTMQWWCEGVLFTAFGVAGLVANLISIGVLSTKDMRKHSFNQLLIALAIFDILFIIVSVPVYSFPLFPMFQVLKGSRVRSLLRSQITI